MELKNQSPHRPAEMVVDMPEEDIKQILDTGEFIKATKEKLVVEKKKEIVKTEDDSEQLYNL